MPFDIEGRGGQRPDFIGSLKHAQTFRSLQRPASSFGVSHKSDFGTAQRFDETEDGQGLRTETQAGPRNLTQPGITS